MKGDLTKQDVAAIVNPTNIRLQLHGAVSKAVLTTVGPIFKVICKVWLASHFGCLLECGAATTRLPPETRAFRMLKYQRVTHAAVPYSTGKQNYAVIITGRHMLTVLVNGSCIQLA